MPVALPAESQLSIEHVGQLVRCTLNRPQVINALSHQMVQQLAQQLALTQAAAAVTPELPSTVILIDGVGERGFCGGGDVKELATANGDAQRAFMGDEYRLNAALAHATVPVVSVMHGITMGGGVGLGAHVGTRIVTETLKMAMPEVKIGIVPDVGGSLILAHAPGHLGDFLAITAGSLTAGDAVALGFADHFVPEAKIPVLRAALAAGTAVADAVAAVAEKAPESRLMHSRSWWDRLAEEALGNAAEVLAAPATAARRLLAAMEQSPHHEARDAARAVRQLSPLSVALSLAELARIREEQLDLVAVLGDDYRLVNRLMVRGDFAEGVRALLIDRDGAPKWQPAHLDEVTDALVLEMLDPTLRAGETEWLLTA